MFGCQMNVADMDDLRGRLSGAGGVEVDGPEQADLVLVNTCTVRAKAEDKALSFFGELKRTKQRADGGPFLVGMGCVVPKSRNRIEQRFSHLDLLLDYSDPDNVMAALGEHFAPVRDQEAGTDFTPLLRTDSSPLRFVTAIRGCRHGCSFCIVPHVRGPQRDVPLQRILAEAQALERAGAPDLTVLGQNILAYGTTSGNGAPRFVELIEALLTETGFRWITYLTSLPCDLTARICERVIAQPRVTPLLHLPLQSGSDRVLSDMRRGHTADDYRRIVAKARECRPDLYLTTDLLVGFPTESEADFEQTLALVEELGFDDAFMFAYSERAGTIAARQFGDPLPREEKLRRLNELIKRQRRWGAERNARYIGRQLEVIIERRNENGGGVARTAFNKPVKLQACRHRPGDFASVEISGAGVSSFSGIEVG